MFAKPTIADARRRRESGAAIVEFALALLPLLGFMFLLMALAWIVFAWACVQEAVREGARTAVTCTPVTGLNNAIQQVVQTYSFGFVNASNASSVFSVQYLDPTTLSPIAGQVYSGDVVKVSVSNLPVTTFAPIMRAGTASVLLVGATSSDIMSCPTPATP
jgi:Flp pilus assembly protein TadG